MSLLDGLEAHWKLDEESGDFADSTGNGHTLTNVSLDSVPGKLGRAAMGDGGGIVAGSSALDTGHSFSVPCWLKFPDVTGSNFLIQNVGGDNPLVFDVTQEHRIQFYIAGSDLVYYGVDSAPLTTDEWHLLIGWWEKGVGIYLQIDNAVPLFLAYAGDNMIPAGDIGVYLNVTDVIDSMSFYSRVLTGDERARLWNNGDGLRFEQFSWERSGQSLGAPATIDTVMRVNRPVAGRELWMARPIDRSPKRGF